MSIQRNYGQIAGVNISIIRKIYNTIRYRPSYYIDAQVFNEHLTTNSETVSIVMYACDSIDQAVIGIHLMARSTHKNIQVILVDNTAETFNSKQLGDFPFRIDYIKINQQTRNWVNPCIDYNIGISYAKGDYIIIQGSSVFHIGDIINHVHHNLSIGKCFFYEVVSPLNSTLNEKICTTAINGSLTYDTFSALKSHNEVKCAYQRNPLLLMAIRRNDLSRLDAPFDYDLSLGSSHADTVLLFQIQNVLGLRIIPINKISYKIMGCKLYQNEIPKNTDRYHYERTRTLNTYIYNRKISQFAVSRSWVTYSLDEHLETSFSNKPEIIIMTGSFGKEYSNVGYYDSLFTIFRNILQSKGFSVTEASRDIIYGDMSKAITQLTSNKLILINPFDFAYHCLRWYSCHSLPQQLISFLHNVNYMIIWQEALTPDYHVRGYGKSPIMKPLICELFSNSKLNIVSNTESINSLKSFGIYQNYYSSIGGYSPINGLVPFEDSGTDKTIDILIYGTMSEQFPYRNDMIAKLCELNQSTYNYRIQVSNDIFDEKLDDCLRKTHIVVHIPSHPDLKHMPWAKIAYLHTRKIFFIIEENDELHATSLFSHIPYYLHNDITNLYNKIIYYLQHPSEMQTVIEKNYDYITTHSNLDVIIPNLMKTI